MRGSWYTEIADLQSPVQMSTHASGDRLFAVVAFTDGALSIGLALNAVDVGHPDDVVDDLPHLLDARDQGDLVPAVGLGYLNCMVSVVSMVAFR